MLISWLEAACVENQSIGWSKKWERIMSTWLLKCWGFFVFSSPLSSSFIFIVAVFQCSIFWKTYSMLFVCLFCFGSWKSASLVIEKPRFFSNFNFSVQLLLELLLAPYFTLYFSSPQLWRLNSGVISWSNWINHTHTHTHSLTRSLVQCVFDLILNLRLSFLLLLLFPLSKQ